MKMKLIVALSLILLCFCIITPGLSISLQSISTTKVLTTSTTDLIFTGLNSSIIDPKDPGSGGGGQGAI